MTVKWHIEKIDGEVAKVTNREHMEIAELVDWGDRFRQLQNEFRDTVQRFERFKREKSVNQTRPTTTATTQPTNNLQQHEKCVQEPHNEQHGQSKRLKSDVNQPNEEQQPPSAEQLQQRSLQQPSQHQLQQPPPQQPPPQQQLQGEPPQQLQQPPQQPRPQQQPQQGHVQKATVEIATMTIRLVAGEKMYSLPKLAEADAHRLVIVIHDSRESDRLVNYIRKIQDRFGGHSWRGFNGGFNGAQSNYFTEAARSLQPHFTIPPEHITANRIYNVLKCAKEGSVVSAQARPQLGSDTSADT